MNRRAAKRAACSVAAKLIENYLDMGQPDHDCMDGVQGWQPGDVERLNQGFDELVDELRRRGGCGVRDDVLPGQMKLFDDEAEE